MSSSSYSSSSCTSKVAPVVDDFFRPTLGVPVSSSRDEDGVDNGDEDDVGELRLFLLLFVAIAFFVPLLPFSELLSRWSATWLSRLAFRGAAPDGEITGSWTMKNGVGVLCGVRLRFSALLLLGESAAFASCIFLKCCSFIIIFFSDNAVERQSETAVEGHSPFQSCFNVRTITLDGANCGMATIQKKYY